MAIECSISYLISGENIADVWRCTFGTLQQRAQKSGTQLSMTIIDHYSEIQVASLLNNL